MNNKIKVFVKLNENNVVTSINSSIFLHDVEGWVEIDEGRGDRFSHAQGNYLPKGLIDNNGHYNYKFDNELVELTNAEKEILFPAPEVLPTTDERLEALESAMLEMILLGGM